MDSLAYEAALDNTNERNRGRPQCRVLQVFHNLGIGGAETWLMAILRWHKDARALLPLDVEIDICLTSGRPEAFDSEAAALGARIYYMKYSRYDIPSFTSAFRRLLAQRQYSAIHDHQDIAAGLHFLCGAGALPPIRIAHFHNPIETIAKGRLVAGGMGLRRLLLATTATYIAGTSRKVLADYGISKQRMFGIPCGALYCGFDTRQYLQDRPTAHRRLCEEFGWPLDSKIVLFVGRLESHFNQKNPKFALEVVLDCISRDTRIRALFVGAGNGGRRALQEEAMASGAGEKVRFTGQRSDVPLLMCGADLLLFPSLAEGLGMVAVEAQAAGLPVLASETTPRECVVVPSLVTFLSPRLPAIEWARAARGILATRQPSHDSCTKAVEASPFAIANSYEALMRLYLPNHPLAEGAALV